MGGQLLFFNELDVLLWSIVVLFHLFFWLQLWVSYYFERRMGMHAKDLVIVLLIYRNKQLQYDFYFPFYCIFGFFSSVVLSFVYYICICMFYSVNYEIMEYKKYWPTKFSLPCIQYLSIYFSQCVNHNLGRVIGWEQTRNSYFFFFPRSLIIKDQL